MTLIEALKRHPHSTARQLASRMGVSVPTAHRRLKAARDAGIPISESMIRRVGMTGPTPTRFALVTQ